MATPDLETDVVALMAATAAITALPELAFSGASRNVWAGPERPATDVPLRSVFVKHYGGTREDHSDGRLRGFGVQVMLRWDREGYLRGEQVARAILDALDRKGRWTANGNTYFDLVASDSIPAHLQSGADDAEYFALNFTAEHDE